MGKYNVVIKSYGDEDYFELITKEPVSYRVAESIDRGANINLNHEEHYTEILEDN